jgi:hypothetical protein
MRQLKFAGQSKIFGGGESDSESSDESGSQEEQKVETVETTKQGARTAKKNLMGDSSEEETERTIKTQKQKKFEILDKILDDLRKHVNISDWGEIEKDFVKMQTEIKSNGKVILDSDENLPKSVLKSLLNLQDAVEEVTNAVKKKMTKANATSYTKLKSNFNKWLSNEENVIEEKMIFGTQLAKYKENPADSGDDDSEADEGSEEEEEEEDEEEVEYEYEDEEEPEDETEEKKEEKNKQKDEKAALDEYDAEEDEEYDEEYDEEEESSEEDAAGDLEENEEEMDEMLQKKYGFLRRAREEMTPTERRWKWVLKECLPLDMLRYIALGQTKKKKKDKEEKKKVEDDAAADNADAADEDKGPGFIVDNKLELDYKIVKNVEETMQALKSERLKGKFNPLYHAKVLNLIVDQFNNPQTIEEKRLQIKVNFYLIGTHFLTIKSDIGFFERE